MVEYYNNQSGLLVAENKLALAKERNHHAVDLIQELMAPAPTITLELVKGLQLRTEILEAEGSKEAQEQCDLLFEMLQKLNSERGPLSLPALHALYMNLGISYKSLAERSLREGDAKGAIAALRRLSQVLPQLSAEDRETLASPYRALQERLQQKWPNLDLRHDSAGKDLR